MWVASRPQSLYVRVFIIHVAKKTSKNKNTPTNQKEKTNNKNKQKKFREKTQQQTKKGREDKQLI